MPPDGRFIAGDALDAADNSVAWRVNLQGGVAPPPQPAILASPRIEADKLVLSFAGLAGMSYQVQVSSSLGPLSWQPLGNPIPGKVANIEARFELPPSARFYRVVTFGAN